MDALSTIAGILAAMAALAALEAVVPLRAAARERRAHLAPNLALTGITFVTNAAFGAALVLALSAQQAAGVGLLNVISLPGWIATALVVIVLDFAFYVTHVVMHKWPAFWRFHRVHHADPLVDVTTTIRQHPGEGVIRYAFLAAFACALGASPAAFALYRALVAGNGLLEHANLRCPAWLARGLALVTTWPHYHKVHHSRDAALTDTNYANLLSLWDRAFGTYTPAHIGASVRYGLAGLDDAGTQATPGLLALPFRREPRTSPISCAPSCPSSPSTPSRSPSAASPSSIG